MSLNENEQAADAPAETPAPEAPAQDVQRVIALLERIQNDYQQIRTLLSSGKLITNMVGSLSCDENFIAMTRSICREFWAEAIAAEQYAVEHGVPVDLGEDPAIKNYIVQLVDEVSNLKACLTSSDHPTNPNGVELFHAEGDPQQLGWKPEWHQVGLGPKATAAIRQALAAQAIEPYTYRYITVHADSILPLSADSVLVSKKENDDVAAADSAAA